MASLGREGYRRIAGDIFRTAAELKDIIRSHAELRVLGEPFFNVAYSHHPEQRDIDIFHVNDSLAANGWRMNGLQTPPAVHFCITRPNTRPGVMDRFADDLATAVAYAKERTGTAPRSGATYGGGGVDVPRDAVAAGMVGWLDATQGLPPTRL
jgi:glutamate/tyrosine decarboxylase-like PLP-dependent enzyme